MRLTRAPQESCVPMTDYYVDEEHEDAYDGDDGEYYDDPIVDDRRRLPRPSAGAFDEVEGRTTWMYLGLLGALFALLVLFSWACDVEPSTPTDLLPTPGEAPAEVGDVAVRLSVEVEGDIVRLTGAVPDDGARQQALDAAANLYGAENVIDELTVDDSTTLDEGVLTVDGSVVFGDGRPVALRDAIVSSLGLAAGDFSVEEGEATVDPVELTAELVDGTISFAGAVPDDGSPVELTAAGEAVFGEGSVDTSGLTVGDVAWSEATVVVTGTTAPDDERYQALPAEIRNRFGSLVEIDISGITIDTGPEVLAGISTTIDEALQAQAITFGANSAEIDPASDAVIATVAEQLGLVPGIPVEVVGHTDDLGPEDENFTLSQLRAEAVVDRLVELGLERGRFSARGAGESEPVADNDTADGRAENRRIEFVLG
ncbi:MAG: OmpA family protein [Actinomycetota bacterium]